MGQVVVIPADQASAMPRGLGHPGQDLAPSPVVQVTLADAGLVEGDVLCESLRHEPRLWTAAQDVHAEVLAPGVLPEEIQVGLPTPAADGRPLIVEHQDVHGCWVP